VKLYLIAGMFAGPCFAKSSCNAKLHDKVTALEKLGRWASYGSGIRQPSR
jgi:hypothetical protein